MKKVVLTLLSLSFSLCVYAQSLRNGSDNGLNLRSQPSANAEVLTSVPANAKVKVVDSSNSEWYKVSYNGKTGYVAAKYLTEEEQQNRNQGNNSSSNNKSSNNSNNNSSSSKSNKGSKKSSGGAGADYNTGIGLRAGHAESGLTVKHFINNGAAIEGILSSGWYYGGSRITGLYEMQKPLGSNFSWFWGVGGHIGMYRERYWYRGDCKNGTYEYKGTVYNCDGSRVIVGIDGIIGLEYKFEQIPFTIGLDLKPSIDIIGWGRSNFTDAAFSFRYVF